jgi:nucleoid-associated protein YgaU
MSYMKNPFILATLGGIIVGIAIALNFMLGDDDAIAQRDKTAPSQIEQAVETPAETIQTQETSSSNAQISLNVEQPDEPATKTFYPAFDVVRITRDGHAVIAGQAEPNARIDIMLDDAVIGTVTADKHGEWVYVPAAPFEPGSWALSLRMTNTSGSTFKSDQIVIINVPERTEMNTDETESFAIALSSDPNKPVVVLQKPGEVTISLLSIDAIDYDDNGEFSVIGTAKANTMVNVYLDDTYIGTSQVARSGKWRLIPETRIKPGKYQLRADQVDDKGNVTERISLPIMRDDMKQKLAAGKTYVVQPGNSLWRIARHTYGAGLQYTIIFTANRSQIRDADLIYPGQIFSLPQPD